LQEDRDDLLDDEAMPHSVFHPTGVQRITEGTLQCSIPPSPNHGAQENAEDTYGLGPQIRKVSCKHSFGYLFLIGLTMLLTTESPEIATSQPLAEQPQLPDSTPAALPKASIPSSATQAENDIFEILNEERESISRGTGQEQPISEAPANVYVITDEDIRHSGATDIPTVLRRIPGMEVMQMSGAEYDVSVRGNNQTAANHLLVLVDGRPIYEYAFGSVFWTLLPVTLPEIKKIEVMKGPSAAIYGFNAFDGVINIVTKSPQEMKGNTNGTYAQFGGGEFGTIRSTLIQAGTRGNFGYRVSFGHDQNQKWSNRDALALRSNKFNILTDYKFKDDSKFILSGGLIDSNRYDGPVFDIFDQSTELTNGYVNAAYERPNFFIRTNWTRWDRSSLTLLTPSILDSFFFQTGTDGSTALRFRNDVYTTWAQHTLDLTSTNRFLYGVNYFHNAVSNQNAFVGSLHEDRLGLYIQDEWKPTSTLTLIAGLRYDLLTGLNPTYSPRLSIIYKPHENHTFRISGSVAYRPPSFLESKASVFFLDMSGNPPTAGLGSKNLNPEQIVTYEGGYQGWYFKHRVRVRADVFYNHLSDFIHSGVPTADPLIFTFANSGQADIYGAEVGAEFLATSWLTGFVNYATAQVHQTSNLVELQNFSATRGAPSIKVNAGLRGEWDNGFSAETLIHHVSAASYPVNPSYQFLGQTFGFSPPMNTVGSYTLLNMRGAYRFWRDRAEVAVTAFNALNDRHRENPTGEVIGTRVMGWVTLRY
jgi:iron complex outermembrane receptor protein